MEAPRLPADRNETLMRLRALAETTGLDSEQRAFLTFCFRASDQEIYYLAADCLGSWLPKDAELAAWFEGYCSTRGMGLREPVVLDGQRTRRRVLLARGAAAASDPEHWVAPLDLDAASAVPRRPPDVAAMLTTLLRLRGQERLRPPVDAALATLLSLLAEQRNVLLHPGTVRVWTRLWVTLRETGSAALDEAPVRSTLEATVAAAATGTVAARLAALAAADAMIVTICACADDPSTWLSDVGSGDSAIWIRQRWQRAWLRQDGHSDVPCPPLADAAATGSLALRLEHNALALATTHTSGPSIGLAPLAAAEATLLEALRPRLSSRSRWLAQPPGERVLCLFLVLDRLADSGPLPMAAHDLLAERAGADAEVSWSGGRSAVLLRLLSRLADWEDLPLAGLVEARRLHAVADPELSLLLLPHRDHGQVDADLADSLADLVEQQLRTALATDPAFDPQRYLTLALVRHPSRAFAAALLRLLAQRSYVDAQGQAVDLQRTVASWAEAVAHPESAGTPWRQLPALPSAPGGIATELEAIAHWLGFDAGSRPRQDTAVAILRRLHGDRRPLLCGDGTGSVDEDVDVVVERVERHLRAALEQAQQVEALALEHAEDAQGLLEDLGVTLDRVHRDLRRHLPAPDGAALDETLETFGSQIDRWRSGLALCRQWARSGPTRPVPELPAALLPALFAALERYLGGDARGRQGVLEQGLAHADAVPASLADAWVSELARRWAQALEAAMAADLSGSVRRMLHDPTQAPLATHPQAAGALAAAKRFCFDRLHLGSARHVATLQGRTAPGRCIGAFLLHYSAVWVGLLVGTILMLDFGDAWKAMAEAGDITGITLTGLLGLGGTWAWLLVSQRRRLEPGPEDSMVRLWSGLLGRTSGFLLLCASYTLAATSGMWLLLSGTDEVVQGPMAIGHIVVWAGFALFAGTFFGLVAKDV